MMKWNQSGCVVPNSYVAGVCTFFRNATQRRVASAVTGTVAAKHTSPNAARYWLRLMSNLPRHPHLQSRILQPPPLSLKPTQPLAARSARQRCAGSVLITSEAGELSCIVSTARTGIEMTEAPHDNTLQRHFVGHFRAARISFCCAWPAASSKFRRSIAGRVVIELLRSTHNLCICFDRHDHTGQNPGDTLQAGR